MAWGSYQEWLAKVLEDEESRPTVPIIFLYHRESSLMLSIQQRDDGDYYDFANKMFDPRPSVPRASMTRLASLGKFSHLYGATVGRSSRLHGQYVVTIRDTGYGGMIVALLSYNIENGLISPKAPPEGLANYAAEEGLPPLRVATAGGRTGRAVDLE